MTRRIRVLGLIVGVAAGTLAMGAQSARAQSDREYAIKAAFLYNFAKFVDWPDEAFAKGSGTITIGVLGDDPFGSALDSINGKTVKDRRVTIKRFRTLQELEPCAILFVSSSERSRLPQVLDSIKASNVLTVGEMDRFAQLGGSVKFKVVENKVRFEINVDAAQRAGLKISSRLLNVAEVVRDDRQAMSITR